jgi:hypothetical protein
MTPGMSDSAGGGCMGNRSLKKLVKVAMPINVNNAKFFGENRKFFELFSIFRKFEVKLIRHFLRSQE